jgi:hypothetical protein
VESGLADDQNFPFEADRPDGRVVVRASGNADFALMLKERPYVDTYEDLLARRDFNIKMLDGALIQMIYEFQSDQLLRHRLAFFPSPSLLSFQDHPEIYETDTLYADILDRRVVAVPLRFDYDNRPLVAKSVAHPVSHLTLGQYANCRIAATGPLPPYYFVEFVLRSFYNTAARSLSKQLPKHGHVFLGSITKDELASVHVGVPCKSGQDGPGSGR